jgi:hypothetical protein
LRLMWLSFSWGPLSFAAQIQPANRQNHSSPGASLRQVFVKGGK